MARAYSLDLRERVVAAVENGGMCRSRPAVQFGVCITTVITWVRRCAKRAALRRARWAGTSRRRSLAQWVFEEFSITIAEQTLNRELRATSYRKLSARPRPHAQAEGVIEDSLKISQRARMKSHAKRRSTATNHFRSAIRS